MRLSKQIFSYILVICLSFFPFFFTFGTLFNIKIWVHRLFSIQFLHILFCFNINFRKYFKYQTNLMLSKIPSFQNSETSMKSFMQKKHFISYLRSSELFILQIESTFEIYLLFLTHFWNSLCKSISMAQQRQNGGNEWHIECVDSMFWMKTKVRMKYDENKFFVLN